MLQEAGRGLRKAIEVPMGRLAVDVTTPDRFSRLNRARLRGLNKSEPSRQRRYALTVRGTDFHLDRLPARASKQCLRISLRQIGNVKVVE